MSQSFLRADYMEILNPGWNFHSIYRVENSSHLNRKLLFEMTLQLHVKISTRYTELRFQRGLANPRWNFNLGWKSQIFHIIDVFSNPGWKCSTTHVRIPGLFTKKVKMTTSQARFKWTDDKHINFIKYLQEFKNSMEFRNCDSDANKVKLYESVRKSLNIHIYLV